MSALPTGLAWHVGFSNLNDLHQVACTSSLILSGLVVARAVRIDPTILQPFQAGLSVFGSVGLFLAGLIATSQFYTRNRRSYKIINAAFFLILLLAVVLGSVFQLASVTNTAITFFILWAFEKIIELSIGRCIWVAVFCLSIFSWQLALWLHNHPVFVRALVNW